VTVKFSLKNTGRRDGMEVAQVYAALPADAGEPPKRLVGWSKVSLKAGETRQMEIQIDPRYLSIYDEPTDTWKLVPGQYTFLVGGSSQNFPLKDEIHLK
jgi:beta-glucosidase